MDFKVTYLDGGLGALSAADRNSFDCLTNEKATEDRSAANSALASTTKSAKPRKTKSEKSAHLANAILNRANLSNVANSTASAAAFTAINSGISPNSATGFEHALNYPPNVGQSARYNSLTDYYAGGHSNAAAAAAYYNGTAGYPTAYNSQTNVTIINNNYNLNVTPNGCLGTAALPTSHLPSSNGALTNENSSCSSLSSNSSFSSCSATVKKKFTSTNDDYDQFNHMLNGHSHHAFHPTASSSTATHLVTGSNPQPPSTSSHHLSANQLNINISNLSSINNLNQNAMLLNGGNTNSFNGANPVNFNSLNSNFVYSPSSSAANLSPATGDHPATGSLSTHAQQLQLVGLSHGSSPHSNPNTPAAHLHDQSATQLSPLSTASNSNQIQALEPMEIDSASSQQLAAAGHQSLSHHLNSNLTNNLNSNLSNNLNNLNSSNSISAELGSPHALSNPASSPQSNSSSSANTNLSAASSSSPSAVALPSHYPYNTANHFLHYSRLSSYYHPEYHLYNYFEPKFKNTMVGNNLISNNLIGNNNLFSNEHSLFPSTNVF